ncbi:MAG: hypothetical protein IJ748_04870 [Bacteroidales bacterium]|nr:hypothetical protein [Bacteroidales bacterium]
MKKLFLVVAILTLTFTNLYSQIENLKLNGYVQTDFELAGKDGSTYVGPAYSQERDGNSDYFFRYGVRRGLIRATFEKDNGLGALELNVTEGGVIPLCAFLQLNPYRWLSFRGGLTTIDYGFELTYPSSVLETVERSVFTRMLFPKEHDLGFMFMLNPSFNTEKNSLYFSFGMMSGNGIHKIADKNMNFMTHLTYTHNGSLCSFVLGTSFYEGKTNNAGTRVYEVENGDWQSKDVSANKKNARRYINFEARLSYESFLGLSSLRSECTFGLQPSRQNSFASQDDNSYNPSDPFSYQRNFLGFYVCYVQKILRTPLSFIAKYTYFDKNTKLSSSEIKNIEDAKLQGLGIGLICDFNAHVKTMLYYDMFSNETNQMVKQMNDNVLRLRLQYKF